MKPSNLSPVSEHSDAVQRLNKQLFKSLAVSSAPLPSYTRHNLRPMTAMPERPVMAASSQSVMAASLQSVTSTPVKKKRPETAAARIETPQKPQFKPLPEPPLPKELIVLPPCEYSKHTSSHSVASSYQRNMFFPLKANDTNSPTSDPSTSIFGRLMSTSNSESQG